MKSVLQFSRPASVAVAVAAPCRRSSNRRIARSRPSKFFQSVEGKWVGPGEIVAGKYKGTKFTCSFDRLDA